MIPWIKGDSPFPSVATALTEPNGLLCAGGDLSAQRLLDAYRRGIFPWYARGEPILWWTPDPRMVLYPHEFQISRSLRRRLRSRCFEVHLDRDFLSVVQSCADTPRPGQQGTWITPEIRHAYGRLFEIGLAHSVETRLEGELVGGLYGVAIGRMFYGESMFSRVTDASKVATAHLVRFLEEQGFGMIDCQMNTPHLASLGAREIPRDVFMAQMHALLAGSGPPGRWPVDGADQPWT